MATSSCFFSPFSAVAWVSFGVVFGVSAVAWVSFGVVSGVSTVAWVSFEVVSGVSVAALASLRTSERVRDTMASKIFSLPSKSLTKYNRLPSGLHAMSRSCDGGDVTRTTGDFSSMLRTKTSPYATKAMVFPSGLGNASEISFPTWRTFTASTMSTAAVSSSACGRACAVVRSSLYNVFHEAITAPRPSAATSKDAISLVKLVNFSPTASGASATLRRYKLVTPSRSESMRY